MNHASILLMNFVHCWSHFLRPGTLPGETRVSIQQPNGTRLRYDMFIDPVLARAWTLKVLHDTAGKFVSFYHPIRNGFVSFFCGGSSSRLRTASPIRSQTGLFQHFFWCAPKATCTRSKVWQLSGLGRTNRDVGIVHNIPLHVFCSLNSSDLACTDC